MFLKKDFILVNAKLIIVLGLTHIEENFSSFPLCEFDLTRFGLTQRKIFQVFLFTPFITVEVFPPP
jgi:hypothetical protein